MKSKFFCDLALPARVINRKHLWITTCIFAAGFLLAPRAMAGDAPSWMHALVNAPLPSYDEKTDAVLLYSETNVTVLSVDKIRTQVRVAYKILRPEGRGYGTLQVNFNPERKIKSLHGWCIPAQGKDYEVKDKDAVEENFPENGILVNDSKSKVLRIPAPDVGNIIGYEFEFEERPFFLQHIWNFQQLSPVRESHYSLQLPPGWEFKASWLNAPEVKPVDAGNNLWKWSTTDVKGIRKEPDMPPLAGVMGQMILTFFPSGSRPANGFAGWADMGKWYADLVRDRIQASPAIQQEVTTLTQGKTSIVAKMQALAAFAQHDIRYVEISFGIGGWQPHAAADVFSHRYGDCKDKAALMRAMLKEIGIDSYHVLVNDRHGVISADSPPQQNFDHAITAIKLPDGVSDPSLIATMQHPRLGKLLFFDPTNEMIPFGQIPVYLQANYGLLVTADSGELVQLPLQPTSMNSVARTGKLVLDPSGRLTGEITEMRLGERASLERWRLKAVTKDADRIKPIETLLGSSLSNFRLTKATLINLTQTQQPFGFDYSFVSDGYAKNAGGLLLVRPRVLGNEALGILETKEPRKFPIEFEGPAQDTDTFEITIPQGYEVDDIPPPVDADYGFASYHSKTEVKGNVIDYTRTFEVKELSVPVSRAEELRKFYRIIASDERNTVVLKASPK